MLLRTDASKHFDNPQFANLQPGLHPDATHWLLDQGIRLIGIDAWGLDRPPRAMAADHKNGIPNSLWPSHLVGRGLQENPVSIGWLENPRGTVPERPSAQKFCKPWRRVVDAVCL